MSPILPMTMTTSLQHSYKPPKPIVFHEPLQMLKQDTFVKLQPVKSEDDE